MKISGLRIEPLEGKSRLIADIECNFSNESKLWFEVCSEYEDILTDDVYDAYLVAALYPAMYYNEAIEIEGPVSEKLYRNIIKYVQPIIRDFAPSFHIVPITVAGFASAKKCAKKIIGTGFSGGIDSFSTIVENYAHEEDLNYRINTLFFFNVGQNGQYGSINTKQRVENRFLNAKKYPDSVGLEYILMDSNMFAFYQPHWEYDAGVLCQAAGAIIFERGITRYYLASSYTYGEMIDHAKARTQLNEFADPYICPLLCTDNMEIILDGAQYRRTAKTALVAEYKPAHKYLNVCIDSTDSHIDAENCSKCSKCMRTLLALECLGAIDRFSAVFDLKIYKQHKFKYKCEQRVLYHSNPFAKDNLDFARECNIKIPSYPVAFLVMLPKLGPQWIKRKIRQMIPESYVLRLNKIFGR